MAGWNDLTTMLTLGASWDLLLRLGAALVCGLVIGWERERKNRPAGVRTHTLVALSAASAMLIAEGVAQNLHPDSDPLRAMEAVLQGLGFIGAGTILRLGHSVKGLTTAASVFMVGTLGLACGVGQFVLAGIGTAIAFGVLRVLAEVNNRDD